MADTQSGIFSVREFSYRRNVLKIAPDAFVTINDALVSRVISPMEAVGSKDTDVRGGISSINVSCAINPAGASRATLEIIAPQYKGLHEDYYTTLPNGTRVPIFTPMMEIKIYMKGRFLEEEYQWAPRYYPVFWGMITGVQENYTGGAYTFSITCEDLLCWWKYQKIQLLAGSMAASYGGGRMDRFPSAFQNMSPWEIILSLFTDSFFMDMDENGVSAIYNFVFPQFSNIQQAPGIKSLKETWGPFARNVIDYWNKRFGFGVLQNGTPSEIAASLSNIPLEMYGLRGPISWSVINSKLTSFLDPPKRNTTEQSSRKVDLDLDFGMLAKVQPYGLFDLYGDGAEPQYLTKLEIANAVSEKVNMEFFVDTNGNIVFKPPLFNLDIATGDVPYYKVGPEEIINFNTNFDSNSIVNILTVTGPLQQQVSLEAIGMHADFDSIKRFGIRSDQMVVSYGMNAEQLKMIAVAEMTRRNGQAYTGSVSIPLRPEMRLGYPVYLPHIDTFYYVTGLSHSYTYGSAATTDLSLQYRRERVFEDGTTGLSDSTVGDVLKACVMRSKDDKMSEELASRRQSVTKANEEAIVELKKTHNNLIQTDKSKSEQIEALVNEQKKQDVAEVNRMYSGPGLLGYWQVSRAEIKPYNQSVTNPGTPQAVVSNELVMITDQTVPYTDKNGYRHIGVYPYGANLVMMKNGKVFDSTNQTQVGDAMTYIQMESTGAVTQTSSGVPGQASTEGTPTTPDQPAEKTEADAQKRVADAQKNIDADVYSPQTRPDSFYTDVFKSGTPAVANSTEVAARNAVFYAPSSSASPGEKTRSSIGSMRQVQITQ
jgi:hypothetical protein